MSNCAQSHAIDLKHRRFLTAPDLHWLKWSPSLGRWGFEPHNSVGVNILIAFFCSIVHGYHRQGQTIAGIDVPLDWLLERCFGPALSRSTIQRLLKITEGLGLINCPTKRPGNNGKRIEFTRKISDICIHGSACYPARSQKDRNSPNSNRQFYNKPERVRVYDGSVQAHVKLKRIEPTLKSLMIVLKKIGVDELSRKRVFRKCQIEIARLGSSDATRNLIDWKYYRAKWPSMSFTEREGVARVDILPIVRAKPQQKAENRDEKPFNEDGSPKIRRAILASLGENPNV